MNLSIKFVNASIYIYATVDEEIITNHDITKESEYLKKSFIDNYLKTKFS